MGVISALMTAINAITGMTELMPAVYFGRLPDQGCQPPVGLVTDRGRDPLLDTAEFEVDQVMVYNLVVEYWATTLAECETWANLMDSRFTFGELVVPAYGTLPQATEVGQVIFEQEGPRSMPVQLIHKCTYPIRIPVMKE